MIRAFAGSEIKPLRARYAIGAVTALVRVAVGVDFTLIDLSHRPRNPVLMRISVATDTRIAIGHGETGLTIAARPFAGASERLRISMLGRRLA
jgi:hypothetical protein